MTFSPIVVQDGGQAAELPSGRRSSGGGHWRRRRVDEALFGGLAGGQGRVARLHKLARARGAVGAGAARDLVARLQAQRALDGFCDDIWPHFGLDRHGRAADGQEKGQDRVFSGIEDAGARAWITSPAISAP